MEWGQVKLASQLYIYIYGGLHIQHFFYKVVRSRSKFCVNLHTYISTEIFPLGSFVWARFSDLIIMETRKLYLKAEQ